MTATLTRRATVPKSAPQAKRFLALAREHRPFLIALGLAALLRIIVSIAYRPALFFFGDSYTYLRTARHFVPSITRPDGYPLFLKIVHPFGHLLAVSIVQHLIGLALGVAVYALVRRLGVRTFGAILATLPVLFDAYQLNIEHSIMAETLFQALLVGAILLLAWRDRPPLYWVAGAGLALSGATLTRTIGLPLILPFVGYMLLRGMGPRRAGVLLAAFAVPLLAYAAWYQSFFGTFALSNFDGSFLYGRVGQFADCSRFQVKSYERVLCDPRPASIRPGTNYYVWSTRSPRRHFHPPRGQDKDDALQSFALRAIFNQPGDYARIVGGDLLHYFAPGRWTGPRDEPVRVWQFHPSTREMLIAINGRPLTRPGQQISVSRPFALMAAGYQRGVFTYGPLIALALLLGLIGSRRAPGLRDRRISAESLLFTSSALIVLLVPTMTVMFDYRYLLPALPLIGPAGVLGANVLSRRAAALLDESQEPAVVAAAPPPPPAPAPTDGDGVGQPLSKAELARVGLGFGLGPIGQQKNGGRRPRPARSRRAAASPTGTRRKRPAPRTKPSR